MVVDTELTEDMMVLLDRIPDKFKEDGDKGDRTRLCTKWKGAIKEHKRELEPLVTDPELGKGLTAKKLRKSRPMYRIYTLAVCQSAISNARKKQADTVKSRDKSKP